MWFPVLHGSTLGKELLCLPSQLYLKDFAIDFARDPPVLLVEWGLHMSFHQNHEGLHSLSATMTIMIQFYQVLTSFEHFATQETQKHNATTKNTTPTTKNMTPRPKTQRSPQHRD